MALDRAAFRSLRNRDVPFLRPPFQPALKLLGNVAQRVPAHRVMLPVGVEEADDALRVLERALEGAGCGSRSALVIASAPPATARIDPQDLGQNSLARPVVSENRVTNRQAFYGAGADR
jgi:hypothetical protein